MSGQPSPSRPSRSPEQGIPPLAEVLYGASAESSPAAESPSDTTEDAVDASVQDTDSSELLLVEPSQSSALVICQPEAKRSAALAAYMWVFLRSRWQYRPRFTLSMVWLSFLVGCTGLGIGAIAWLTQLPPLPDCQKLSPLAADVDQLYCAQQAAQSGKLVDLTAAMQLVEGWPPQHPLYSEAQGLLAQWSSTVLAIAEEKLAQGNVKAAVEAAQLIPNRSPVYGDAQATIAQWQTEWTQGQDLQKAAQDALKTRDWDQARDKLKAMLQLEHDYWVQEQGGQLRQRLQIEEQAYEQLKQARDLAKSEQPEDLSAAIALAQTIPLQTYLWEDTKADIDAWSQRLLNIGFQRWEQGDLDGAIAVVQGVPADPTLAPEARDLIQIAQAEKTVVEMGNPWQPSLSQILQLREAITAIAPIPPESPFYERAQEHLTEWQSELADLIQLQYAHLTASLGHQATYQFAIQQAGLLNQDRPRYQQAQTLMAHWTKEIQRLEDRPYLARADRLAQQATVPALRAAIALASRIELGRALRLEAQTAIAAWQDQIEVIEDQPILDEANQLAQVGKLSQAIEVAQAIQPERALYQEAQKQIGDWTYRIQVAQDQPILDQAIALANRGSLTRAIETASQIGSGRALYREARGYIARWRSEREAIWQAQEAEAAAAAESYSEDEYYDDSGYYDDGYYDDGYYDDSEYYDDGYYEDEY